MRAYVLCQMDYSSPLFPEMDGPLWIFKSVPSLLGFNYLCEISAYACLMWNRLHSSVCLCFCEMDYPTKLDEYLLSPKNKFVCVYVYGYLLSLW